MQFECEGWKYKIVFEYRESLDRRLLPVRQIRAHLMTYFSAEKEWRGVGFGVSTCASTDHFDKEKGRKLALARALDSRDRKFRSVAWKAYHTRQGGLLQPTVGEKLVAAWTDLAGKVAAGVQ